MDLHKSPGKGYCAVPPSKAEQRGLQIPGCSAATQSPESVLWDWSSAPANGCPERAGEGATG